MKVLLINGSPHQFGCTYTALKEVADTLNRNDVATEIYHIGPDAIRGCVGCGSCFTTQKCIFEDGVNEISSRLVEFDGIVVGSPVYYAGASGQLCCFLDRLFYSNMRSGKMAGKVAAAVVSCRRGGASTAFDRLNKYFMINKMPIASSQYWNQVHGNKPEEVKQDLEGMQTMRTLGENIAYAIRNKDAGLRERVKLPEYERPVMTNFIRKEKKEKTAK